MFIFKRILLTSAGWLSVCAALPFVYADNFPATLPAVKWHIPARPWVPLNTPRTDPLNKVEDIVNQLVTLQYWNTSRPGDVQDGGDVQNGSIIDPFNLREHQYATPYFSFAVATVVSQGRSVELLEAGARALDHATADIAGLDGSAKANDSHGEFFGAPMMKALRLFKAMSAQYPDILTQDRIARWETRLSTSRVSYMNNGVPQNWRTYGMKGEWLRVQNGLIPRYAGTGSSSYQGVDYIEYYWNNEQRPRYYRDRDTFGLDPYFLMYHDDDTNQRQNFAYHGGATGNLLDLISNGYDGPSRQDIEDTTRFAARSSLLQMAGSGDAPASGRTGNHVWNDIVYGNTYDQVAELTWKDGDAWLAGQFRRAARLAFQSAWRFQQEQGWFSVTKNLLPPAQKNVYFSWSALTNYNGYTEIHSSEDFATRVTDIPEEPTPAEIGGFAFNLDPQFGVAFANAGGMEVQMVTRGSSQSADDRAGGINCFTLGIVRFSRPNWESRLGPGDGWMASDWSQAISFSPTFQENGIWKMVSEMPDRYEGVFTPVFVHPLLVRGTLVIQPKSGQTGPTFEMDLTLTPDGVLVDTQRTSGTQSFGVTWPLMEFDGKHVMDKSIGSHIASTEFPKESSNRQIMEAEQASLTGGIVNENTNPGWSGTGYVSFPAGGGAIEWASVDGGDGGAATVGFRYTLRQSAAATRTVTLRINGEAKSITFENTGNPNTYGGGVLNFPMYWHQLHVPVTFLAGQNNTVRLEADAASGLSIDEMRVFPADASQPEPDQQNFISLDASPTIDASLNLRRSAYGDQRPLRVTNSDLPVSTFVYPRKASDPTAEVVRTSFVRVGEIFSSVLARIDGNIYIGRTAAGGESDGIDLDGDGIREVSFDQICQFVLRLSEGRIQQIETDRYVLAEINGMQVRMAPFTPIDLTSSEAVWHHRAVDASGLRFEVTTMFAAPVAGDTCRVGFGKTGVTDQGALVAGINFAADGRVNLLQGENLVDLSVEPGALCRVRVLFDLIERTYTLWVKPGTEPERRLAVNVSLPDWVTAPGDVAEFAYTGDAAAAGVSTVKTYAVPVDVKINFQNSSSAGYAGYLADNGEALGDRGNGYTYGWIEGANTGLTRNRNSSASPDERYDTLNQMQYNNPATESHTWEIQVPPGVYDVHLVCGDPGYTDSYYHVMAEGVSLVEGDAQGTGQHFFEGTASVTVTDGALTLTNGAGSYRNKVCFIEITGHGSGNFPYVHYQDWAKSHALVDADPLADPDQDGLPNLLEYATGGDPLTKETNMTPSLKRMDNADAVSFRFPRFQAAVDVSCEVWESENLRDWSVYWSSDADSDYTATTIDPLDQWVTISSQPVSNHLRQFFRLSVQTP